MRLIDADALMEKIKEPCKDCTQMDCGCFLCDQCEITEEAERVEEAPTVDAVPIWHDVKLELPTKERADYLCVSYFDIDMPGFEDRWKWDVSIFRFYDGKFWWFSDNEEYEQNDVVFWMEIPEYPMVIKDGQID